MKRCFRCKTKLPLWLFKIDRMKYQLKSAMGRSCSCRFCSSNMLYAYKGNMVRFNWEIRKFEVRFIKPSVINWIKVFIGRL